MPISLFEFFFVLLVLLVPLLNWTIKFFLAVSHGLADRSLVHTCQHRNQNIQKKGTRHDAYVHGSCVATSSIRHPDLHRVLTRFFQS